MLYVGRKIKIDSKRNTQSPEDWYQGKIVLHDHCPSISFSNTKLKQHLLLYVFNDYIYFFFCTVVIVNNNIIYNNYRMRVINVN